MESFNRGILKIAVFIAVCLVVLAIFPRFSPVLYPPLPKPSAEFDCDDGALTMYYHFQRLGLESTPVIGNLNLNGEKYMECNHVWLLVQSGDKAIAYDWGEPKFDSQHYEGYAITLADLLYAVDEDRKNNQMIASAEY